MHCPIVIGVALILAFAGRSSAQVVHVPLFPLNGDSANDWFGYAVSSAGDVNNDGYDDIIVGAPRDDIGGTDSGTVRVFSGVNGALLYTYTGPSFDEMGFSVSGAGDVNNDGHDDFIIGVWLDDPNGAESGSARVVSGLSGALLYTFNGDSAGDLFGTSVSGAGDVNNDGFDDVIVGAHGDDNNGSASGTARVYSGVNGSVLYTFVGDSPLDFFGQSVSGAGDVNDDGFGDVIVGAYGDDNNAPQCGSARVFSGINGSILYTFNGDGEEDILGVVVSGAGDVNGDGFDDVIAGAYGDDNNGDNSGSARVYSGANGAVLYTFNGDSTNDEFGLSVSDAGDINSDGFDDLIVGARGDDNNGADSGSARVFSGFDGSIIHTFNGDSAFDLFGSSVSSAGDLNLDGIADLIIGARLDDPNGADSGSARVFITVPVPTSCPGDTNGDDAINLADLNSVLFNFGLAVPGVQPTHLCQYYPFNGDSIGDRLGNSVSGAGDVNNDGYDDLIVGVYRDDLNGAESGTVRVFSGLNGSTLYTFNGDSANDEFGYSVSDAGDVNNDGIDDLIVGAHLDNNNGSGSGSARVFSGVNGSILYTFNGDNAGDGLGVSVSGAGDVNNDGFDDLVVGAPYDDNAGTTSGIVRVFSGINGAVLYTFNGDSAGNQLGASVSGAGDVNNDGFDDIIVGANDGARVFSGLTGSALATVNLAGALVVSGAGDVNSDGYADFIVGIFTANSNRGSAQVFSGLNGSILSAFTGDRAGDEFGTSVSGAGDVNNDGFDDFIVGAPRHDNNGPDTGSARVFISVPLPGYCPGDTNCDGAITLTDLNTVLFNFGLSCP